jgi:hypothetical protein
MKQLVKRGNTVISDERTERWHVGKEVPLAMIAGMLLQTGGVIWWAASLSVKIDYVSAQIIELKSEKQININAQRDVALATQRIDELDRRVINLEKRR